MSDDLLSDDAQSPSNDELRPQEKPTADQIRGGVDTKAAPDDNAATGDLLSGDEGSGKNGVPDAYTFDAPDGFDPAQINQDQLKLFDETARSIGLTQEQYQAVVEHELKRTEQANEAAVEAWQQQVQGWQEEAKVDKEFGGAAYAESMQHARSALSQFGDDSLRALLADPSPDNPTGLGLRHHPAILRTLSRIGKAMSDPSLIEGNAKPEDEGALKRLYPSMFKETA